MTSDPLAPPHSRSWTRSDFEWPPEVVSETQRTGSVLETNFKFIIERLVVEEDPWILVLSVPMVLQLRHALHNALQL